MLYALSARQIDAGELEGMFADDFAKVCGCVFVDPQLYTTYPFIAVLVDIRSNLAAEQPNLVCLPWGDAVCVGVSCLVIPPVCLPWGDAVYVGVSCIVIPPI